MATEILQIELTVPRGREVVAAKLLSERLPPMEWAILAALAAELVHQHEIRTGATVVVVAAPEQAERVLRDIAREVR